MLKELKPPRALEKKIGGILFERTALSRKPKKLIEEEINAAQGPAGEEAARSHQIRTIQNGCEGIEYAS